MMPVRVLESLGSIPVAVTYYLPLLTPDELILISTANGKTLGDEGSAQHF
jgi:hypothetical protein